VNISKYRLIILCILGALLLAFHVAAKPKPEGKEIDQLAEQIKQPAKWQGKVAPDFELELMNGEKFRLSEQIGKKAIIINFFATWCEPCKQEMPELVAYHARHASESLLMIGINDDEKRDLVEGFITQHHVAYPVGIDKKNQLKKLFGVRGLPTTVFIGADGIIHVYQIGPVLNSDVAFEELYRSSRDIVAQQKGVTKDVYLKLLQAQTETAGTDMKEKEESDDKNPLLAGRPREIGEKMTCPCGCSTGKKIRERLQKMNMNNKNDADIMKELNKEFCEKL